MIGYIKGQICDIRMPIVCVLTASGVGYDVELPLSVFCQLSLGQEVGLWTHLVVREDAWVLCGFVDKEDRNAFKKLIKINGMGAKMALATLSNMNAKQLSQCVYTSDEAMLTAIPGVGKKTAQRLIIELKGKLDEFGGHELGGQSTNTTIADEVQSALINLGYSQKEAQNAIKLADKDTAQTDIQNLLKATLKILSGF